MKTLSRLSAFLCLWVCLFLCAPVSSTSRERIQQDARKDTLVLKLSPGNPRGSEHLVKPLPRFHPGKDSAGFQFIPVWPDPPRVSQVPQLQGLGTAPYLKRPTVLKTVEPVYPDSARRVGLEGTVTVLIWVDEKGKARKVEILKSDADIFNQPAIEAAMKFVFKPENTISLLRHEFQFHLHKNK